MTERARAREDFISAETRVEQVFHSALERLNKINTRLLALHDEIKASQPVASGSICLELYACGASCAGCPHARWVKYEWTKPPAGQEPMLRAINLTTARRDPVLCLNRKAAHFAMTAKLIREAKAILAERTALLAAVAVVRKTCQRRER